MPPESKRDDEVRGVIRQLQSELEYHPEDLSLKTAVSEALTIIEEYRAGHIEKRMALVALIKMDLVNGEGYSYVTRSVLRDIGSWFAGPTDQIGDYSSLEKELMTEVQEV